jgi:hypothetical protein
MPKKKIVTVAEVETPTLDLSPEEIAALEADRAQLLARLGAGATKPPEARVVDLVENPVEPIAETPQGPSPSEIQTLIDQASAEHQEAMNAASQSFDARMAELLKQRRQAEDAESRLVNAAIAPSVAEALEAVRAGNTTSLTSERAGSDEIRDAQVAEQRARVAPVLGDARRAGRELKKFNELHGGTIDAVRSMTVNELRAGLPLTGMMAERSISLVSTLHRTADAAREMIDKGISNTESTISAIESLFRRPTNWGGAQNSWGVRSQETIVELNTLLRDLGRPADLVPVLNQQIEAIAGLLQSIAALRARYVGSPELVPPVDVEKAITAKAVKELVDTAAGLGPDGQQPLQRTAILDDPRGLFGDGSPVGR